MREVATKDVFYRVVRHDMKPTFVLLDVEGRRIHSRTYTKYLTEQERRTRPHEGEARSDYDEPYLKWESAIESRLGFKSPADFRDLISKIPFELIERLPCDEFPE